MKSRLQRRQKMHFAPERRLHRCGHCISTRRGGVELITDQMKRKVIRVGLLLWMINLVIGGQRNNNWQYNDPHYDNAQYTKLYGQATGENPVQEKFGPFQYQYVDYQPNCKAGGQPVCATNGIKYFQFENDCKLEAENIKLLFQYGTELELTELERCIPHCDNIKCTTKYAPVCAAPESGPHQGQGVTFANECEVRRRECISKETQRFLNEGPCHQLQSKSKSKSKGKRKHRRRGGKNRNNTTTSSTTTTTPIANSNTSGLVALPALTEAPRTSTTTSTMQFHEYLSQINPGVSISQAVNAYNVYNIPDVGKDYDEITDSSLSLYLPGVGTVTDTPPQTTSTTTTTTTTTPKPATTTLPSTSSTKCTTLPPTTTTPKRYFIFLPHGTTSTTTVRTSMHDSNSNVVGTGFSRSSIKATSNSTTTSTVLTNPTTISPLIIAKNATFFKVNAETTVNPIQKTIAKPNVAKTEN